MKFDQPCGSVMGNVRQQLMQAVERGRGKRQNCRRHTRRRTEENAKKKFFCIMETFQFSFKSQAGLTPQILT